MKSRNTIALLTLATASLLTACGSGGSKAPETMPAPAPKLEQDKAPEKGKEQGGEKSPEVAPPAPKAPEKQPEVAPPAPKAPEKQPEVAPPAPQAPEKQPEVVPPAPQAPEKKPEAPKRDNQPKQPKPDAEKQQPVPEVRKTDAEVFNSLSLESIEGVIVENLFKLVFNDGTRKLGLDIVPPHSFTGSPKIETLRDLEGTLVGYYGYARVSEQKRDEARPDGEKMYAADRHFFLQSPDFSQLKHPDSLGNVTYKGKMFYQYNNSFNGAEEADVSAIYSGETKRLSMDILGKEGQWRLHADKSFSGPASAVLQTSGLVAGNLAFRENGEAEFKPNGTFVGGFYGKNGSVLTGKAKFDDREKGWEGVIGATAVPGK